ncbi:MAG: hypothetical protein JWP01_410 [Myxococcales bacterium]|nr:hypothetical protein [Myxococcales bacterium]
MELGAFERGEPGPQPDERRARHLGLHAREAFDRGQRRERRALEEQLPGERGAIEIGEAEDAQACFLVMYSRSRTSTPVTAFFGPRLRARANSMISQIIWA